MENEFDSIDIDSAPVEANKEENEFDAYDIDGPQVAGEPDIKSSMYVAAEKNPDHQAKVINLASKSGMPTPVVERNYDEIFKQFTYEGKDYASIIKKSPKTAEFIKNVDNAALVQDDLDNQTDIEKSVQDYSTAWKALAAFNQGMTSLASRTVRAAINLPAAAIQEYAINPIYEAYGEKPVQPLASNPISDWLDKQAESYGAVTPELHQSVIDLALEGKYSDAGAALGYQAVSQMPQMVGMLMGNPTAYLTIMGGGAAADKYKELQAQGIEGKQAVNIAAASGTIEAATEKLPLDSIAILGKEVVRKFGKAGAIEIFKSMGKTLLAQGTVEGVEEMAASFGNALLDYSTDVDKDAFKKLPKEMANAGLLGFVSGAAGTGPGIITQSSIEFAKDRETQNGKDFYTALGEKWNKTKLSKRLSAKQVELVETMTKDGPVEFVYVDTNALEKVFNQSGKSPTSEMNELGASLEYQEAKETGGPVKISTAKWAEKFVGTDAYNALVNDVKFSPEAQTANERNAEKEKLKADLAAQEAQATEEQKIAESGKAVIKDVATQLKEINENPQSAKVYRAFEVLGRRAGKDPLELYNQYNLKISRGATPTQAALEVEATPEVLSAKVFSQGEKPIAPPFYSRAIKTVEEKMGGSASVEQINGMLKEIKPEERKWMGLDTYLKGKTKVSKEELLANLRGNMVEIKEVTKSNADNGKKVTENDITGVDKVGDIWYVDFNNGAQVDVREFEAETEELARSYAVWSLNDDQNLAGNYRVDPTKFSQYVLPGGENYREVLFTLPGNEFRSSHFDEPGIIAHARLNDRFSTVTTGPVDTKSNESSANSLATNAKTLSDIVKSKAFTSKGFGGLNVKDQEAMLSSMVGSVGNKNILGSIIELIPVDVMNNIKSSKTSPEEFLSNKAMLSDSFSPDSNSPIRFSKGSLRAFISSSADLIAKESLTAKDAIGFSNNTGTTPGTFNDRHKQERILFIEEIQSDLHQAGRKKGYKGELPAGWTVAPNTEGTAKFKVRNTKGEMVGYGDTEAEAIAMAGDGRVVPDAPFRKTWHEFVLKRLIREAAEKGYDKIAWTTGEQQADRYDLSKQIDEIAWNPDTEHLIAYQKDSGSTVIDQKVSKDDLSDYIGKEAAEKISNAKPRKYGALAGKYSVLANADLKVGGEGMKGFYDKILVDFANKFGKKYGAKVDDITITSGKKTGTGATVEEFKQFMDSTYPDETVMDKWENRSNKFYQEFLQSRTKNVSKVHSLTITPELKKAALGEGFSLFQGERGKITFGPNNRAVNIELLKTADKSTFLHETSHFITEVFGDIVAEIEAKPEGERTPDQIGLVQDYRNLLNWAGVEPGQMITVEAHEKIAEGFEKYLFEGKAPIPELKKIFARFRVWLMSVYRALGPQIELTDEVRGIFDRLLATQEEIDAVNKDYNGIFSGTLMQGMGVKEAAEYASALNEASESVSADMTKKLVDRQNKIVSEEWKNERNLLIPGIRKTVEKMPVYMAIDKMLTATLPNGDPLKLNFKSVAEYGPEVYKRLPKGVVASKSSGSGVDVETAAQLLGFDSGNELITRMSDVQEKEAYIMELADKEMDTKYPDFFEEGKLSDEVIQSYHTQNRSKKLRMELEYLVNNNLPIVKKAIRKVARRVPTEMEVREQAVGIIAKKRINDISPKAYERLERKAAKEAGALLSKGDIEGAFNAKRIELLNHELFLAAQAANDEVASISKKIKKIVKSDEDAAKSRDMNLVNTAKSILALHGIGNPMDTPEAWLKQVKDYDPDTYPNLVALVQEATQQIKNVEQMPLDQFIAMTNSVIAIWDLAREIRTIEIEGKKVELEKARLEIQDKINQAIGPQEIKQYEQAATFWDKTSVALLGAKASLTRVESWADTLDLGDVNGPTKTYIFNPVSDGATKYRLKQAAVLKDYRKILEAWSKSQKPGKIVSDELGYIFKDKVELMMAVLHSGNDSNLSKLLRGARSAERPWGSVDENGVLDRSKWDAFINRLQTEGILTKADYDFAQNIWDLMESLKPEAQRAHKQMHGYYFSEITANAIETPWGKYRGGYIPAKVDAFLSEDAAIRQEREDFEKNNNSFQFPTTGRGFTKKRVDQYAAPLILDMSLLGGHIDSVLRFTYIEPAVKQVSRIVMNKDFRATLKKLDPTIGSEMLVPWLQRAAQQRVVFPSDSAIDRGIDKMASYLRRTVAMQIMMGNLKNSLEQITGIIVAASKVDKKYLRNASVTYLNGPKKAVDSVLSKSDYMKTIYDSSIYESKEVIDKIILDPSTFEKIQDFSQRHVYFLQTATQNIVNTTVWLGAYEEAIEKKLSEKEAVRAADSAVRLTQGSVLPEDISRFETGTATRRLFTQFAGYFNMLFNLRQSEIQKIARTIGLRKGAGRLFYLGITTNMLPGAISLVIAGLLTGKLFEDDDDDGYLNDLLGKYFGQVAGTELAMVPYAGQVANAGMKAFNDNFYDDRISLSPVVSSLESAAKAPAELYKVISTGNGSASKAIKDSFTLVGIALGVPAGPIARPVSYATGVAMGEIEPKNEADLVRGLVTGTKGSNK